MQYVKLQDKSCKCGCGEPTKGGRTYLYLHDPDLDMPRGYTKEKICTACNESKSVYQYQFYIEKKNKNNTPRIMAVSMCRICRKTKYKSSHVGLLQRNEYFKQKKKDNVGNPEYLIKEKLSSWRKQNEGYSDLTSEYLINLYNEQEGKCYYTGVTLECTFGKKKVIANSMSLDKLDPKGGYIQGNVVWCTYWVNTAKWNHTEEEFYSLIKKIIETRKL